MGKEALEGLPGVIQVTKGWKGFTEINTVTYDRTVISVEEMEEALRKARTYMRTIREE